MSEADSRAERHRIYDRVVSVVEHQTSPEQPPGCTPGTLWTVLVDHANEAHEAVDKAHRAAIENDDIVVWEDAEGTRRLSPANPETLRRAVRRIASWDEPDTETIGRLNTRIQELEGGDQDG